MSAEAGKQILKTFKEASPKPSIFESFGYMDRREDYIRAQRDNNPDFQQFFDDSCQVYKEDPEGYQPQRRSYHSKKNMRKPKSNFTYRKQPNNNYYNKTSYYKRVGNGNINKNGNETWQNKPVNIEEQFVVKTEIKQNKKVSDLKAKGGKESYNNFGHYKPYHPENLDSSNKKIDSIPAVAAAN